ncbi:riboflavin biosynthesis protein RibD domain-containing protein [Colletotrichum cereale]|nr:riboflavin biosynthesis protein RibD domain-containing protein [Colletotrichum cereale]
MGEPSRRLRYNVAISLDGFIAPLNETAGSIVQGNNISFDDLYAQCDTFLMGRKTHDRMFRWVSRIRCENIPRKVVSKTLKSEHHPAITIVSEDFIGYVADLKHTEGRDIWLMGGEQLVGSCIDAGILDSVETAIMPLMLRKGVRMAGESAQEPLGGLKLELMDCRQWETSGIVMCKYNIRRQMAASLGEAMFG